ncbi:glycosyltransferase [Brevirhabdus sp.]|uniref:glycosyltransferase n=1 Tax=Brevirhabdus sp. TaxID=2004514 RepID=UPI0040583B5C
MHAATIRQHRPLPPAGAPADAEALCAALHDCGALSASDRANALAQHRDRSGGITDILIKHGFAQEGAVLAAWAECLKTRPMSAEELSDFALDTDLLLRIGADFCLRHRLLPLRRVAGVVRIASADPENAQAQRDALERQLGEIGLLPCPAAAIEARILSLSRRRMAERAETCVRTDESCRTLSASDNSRLFSLGGAGILLAVTMAPSVIFAAVFLMAAAVLIVNTLLKLTTGAFALRELLQRARRHLRARLHARRHAHPPGPRRAADLPELTALPVQQPTRPAPPVRPVVSLLVALYHEDDIAADLLRRLGRLRYPRAMLDICLIVEEEDAGTRAMLQAQKLPAHMRLIVVPRGTVRTKPRALNFALPMCRGQIVGVYDAEDAPEPAQIDKIVDGFARAGPDVGCIQGILDFYNPEENWLSRCFAIEYAMWFRVVLPGLSRMGMPVPLGGTTVFFRRDVLEDLGGWDAHNVTEDADLGIRLARHGYRTALVDTVTLEEANCRLWPWVRQRSRWIKGYAMTYRVHMRRPRLLLAQLGPVGFLGFQALFLGSLLGFLLAPVLLSFWVAGFGAAHPVSEVFPAQSLWIFLILFLLAEVVSLGLALLALQRRGMNRLGYWALTLHVYFPIATVAAFKALYELIVAPFYWDKTAHRAAPTPPARGAP